MSPRVHTCLPSCPTTISPGDGIKPGCLKKIEIWDWSWTMMGMAKEENLGLGVSLILDEWSCLCRSTTGIKTPRTRDVKIHHRLVKGNFYKYYFWVSVNRINNPLTKRGEKKANHDTNLCMSRIYLVIWIYIAGAVDKAYHCITTFEVRMKVSFWKFHHGCRHF